MEPIYCGHCEYWIHVDPDDNKYDDKAHWKACSLRQRQDIRHLLKHDRNNPILRLYHPAIADMYKEESKAPLVGHNLYARTMRIFRMWRANELCGRFDYLQQLDNVERYGEPNTVELQIENFVFKLFHDTLHNYGNRLKIVMAIEDNYNMTQWCDEKDKRGLPKYPYERMGERPYTCIRDSSGVPAREHVFNVREKAWLETRTFSRQNLFELEREFHSLMREQERHRYAIALGVYHSQLAVSKDVPWVNPRMDEWTQLEDDALLDLLIEGLPMVEITRRLNANLSVHSQMTVRKQENVEARIDDLLIMP